MPSYQRTDQPTQQHTNRPSHAVLSALSLNPLLQLSHTLAPSLAHFAPDARTPLAHEQTFAAHVELSSLTFHPVSQLATAHPDEYDLARGTAQPANKIKEYKTSQPVRNRILKLLGCQRVVWIIIKYPLTFALRFGFTRLVSG